MPDPLDLDTTEKLVKAAGNPSVDIEDILYDVYIAHMTPQRTLAFVARIRELEAEVAEVRRLYLDARP